MIQNRNVKVLRLRDELLVKEESAHSTLAKNGRATSCAAAASCAAEKLNHEHDTTEAVHAARPAKA